MRTPIIRKLKVTLPCSTDGDLFRKWSESSACVYLPHLQLLSGCLPQPAQLCPAGREERRLLFVGARTERTGGGLMSAEHLFCVCACRICRVWRYQLLVMKGRWYPGVHRWVGEEGLPSGPAGPCFETTNVYGPLQAKSSQLKSTCLTAASLLAIMYNK